MGPVEGEFRDNFAISKEKKQLTHIMEATKKLFPEVKIFLSKRTKLLLEMDKLRNAPDKFEAE